MRKLVCASLLALILAGTAMAQPQAKQPQNSKKQMPTPEQMVTFQAQKMASELMLNDEQAAKFVPVFKSYKTEMFEINAKYRPCKKEGEFKGEPLSDEEVKARIEANFEKSQKILDLRKAYYQKFLDVLNPRQIMKLYQMEKQQAQCAGPHKKPRQRF